MLNKKMLLSLLVIGVVAVTAGAGTWAAFSDEENSVSNSFTAGTLDLILSGGEQNGDSVINTFTTPNNWAPGQSNGPTTLTITNAGTIDASTVKLTVDTENSGGVLTEPEEVAEGETADEAISDDITIIQLDYPTSGTSILTDVELACGDEDGILTLTELGTLTDYDLGSLTGTDSADLVMTVLLDSDVGNEHQGDSTSITMTFLAEQ